MLRCAVEPLALVRHGATAGQLSLAIRKPRLLPLPRLLVMRVDKRVYSSLRNSGFPGAKVE